jgi:hypothetical protein
VREVMIDETAQWLRLTGTWTSWLGRREMHDSGRAKGAYIKNCVYCVGYVCRPSGAC